MAYQPGQSNQQSRWQEDFDQGFNADEPRGLGYIQSIGALFSSVTKIAQDPGGWAGAIQGFNFGNIGRQFGINTSHTTMNKASKPLINGFALAYLVHALFLVIITLLNFMNYGRFYGVGTLVSKTIGLAVSLGFSTVLWGVVVFVASKFYDYWQTLAYKIVFILTIISCVFSAIGILTSLAGLLAFSIYSIIGIAESVLVLYSYLYILNALTQAEPYLGEGQTQAQGTWQGAQQQGPYQGGPQQGPYQGGPQQGYNAQPYQSQPQQPYQSQAPSGGSVNKWKRNIEPQAQRVYCPQCGVEILNGQTSCPVCGTPIT